MPSTLFCSEARIHNLCPLEYVAMSVVDLAVEIIIGGRIMELRGQDVENVILWLLKSSEIMTEVVLDKMTVYPGVDRLLQKYGNWVT